MAGWFDVDKKGLSRLVRRRGVGFIGFELLQNVFDTAAKVCAVTIEPIEGRPLVRITVEDDDPDGFQDLAHAFTLFAESVRKGDPEKRGRFNLGEKLVLAAAESASIRSTKGTVSFSKDGERASTRSSRMVGTEFVGVFPMTRDEVSELRAALALVIPPKGIVMTVDGVEVSFPLPIHTIELELPTEYAAGEGVLHRTKRRTQVRIYESYSPNRIYEMGIPIHETDLPWTVEVMQKVPLGLERDHVSLPFHRALSVGVVNAMHARLTPEMASRPSVQIALEDSRIVPEAVRSILTQQHGEKRVTVDPREPESNARAFGAGFTVLHGSAYTKDQWENIRRAEAAPPAPKLFPIARPYSDSPDAKPAEVIPEEKWTAGMRNIAEYAIALAWKTIHRVVDVRFENRFGAIDAANYGYGQLCFNIARLGKSWFAYGPTEAVDRLLIHELAHEYGKHLTKEFDDGLAKIGAKMRRLAIDDPAFFRAFEETGKATRQETEPNR